MTERFRNELCHPNRGARFFRWLFMILLAILTMAVILMALVSGTCESAMIIFIIAGALPAIGFALLLQKEIAYSRLCKFGRMSCDFLENNGLLGKAALEYYNDRQVECTMTYKGSNINFNGGRKTFLTSNFIFIMSSNTVLTYGEIDSAYMTKLDMIGDDKKDTVEFYVVQMWDGTEIPIMSVLTPAYFASSKAYQNALGKIHLIKERIKASNPDCDATLETRRSETVSADIIHYLKGIRVRNQ